MDRVRAALLGQRLGAAWQAVVGPAGRRLKLTLQQLKRSERRPRLSQKQNQRTKLKRMPKRPRKAKLRKRSHLRRRPRKRKRKKRRVMAQLSLRRSESHLERSDFKKRFKNWKFQTMPQSNLQGTASCP